MKYVQIMAYAPLHSPEVTKVPATLETMQDIVGGLVEVFDVTIGGQSYQVVVNEDAEARGLPPNRTIGGQMLYGTFVVTKYVDGIFASIPTKEVLKVWDHIDEEQRK